MKIILKYFFAIWATVCFGQMAYAQVNDDVDGEVQDAEIVIEKERKIELNNERKLYEFIKWRPERVDPTSSPIDFKWYDYMASDEPTNYKPEIVPASKNEDNYQHYAKAGFGNYASPLLDVSLTGVSTANQMLGLNVKHRSFGTGVVDSENSGAATTEANLYGTLIQEQFKLNSFFNYRLEKSYYYGYPEGTAVNRGDIKHSANFLNFGLGLIDSKLDDQWTYEANFDFKNYSDNFNAKENTFLTELNAGYSEVLFLNTSVVLSKYQDVGIDESRSYFRLNPYYRLQIENLTLDLGVSINVQNDDFPDLESSRFFPYAKASYPLTGGYTVFAKLDGGFTFNTLYEFAHQSGVLNQSTTLANSERLLDFSGGIVGTPIEHLSLTATLAFQSVRYLPVLVNNTLDQSRIDIIYDIENSKIVTFKAKGLYQINDFHELSLGVNLYSYSSKGYDQIYHRPTSEIHISGNHLVLPKLRAKWNFVFMSGLAARGAQVTDPDVSLDPISKLDIELHYQLKEQWGIFLSGDNLFNQEYSRYLYFPQRGIQVKGGVTFRL